jgi:hypothetical protein
MNRYFPDRRRLLFTYISQIGGPSAFVNRRIARLWSSWKAASAARQLLWQQNRVQTDMPHPKRALLASFAAVRTHFACRLLPASYYRCLPSAWRWRCGRRITTRSGRTARSASCRHRLAPRRRTIKCTGTGCLDSWAAPRPVPFHPKHKQDQITKEIYQWLDERRGSGHIPSKVNRKRPIAHDPIVYRQSRKIENMFGRLKNWRRIYTHNDRCAHTLFSRICIAAIVTYWL